MVGFCSGGFAAEAELAPGATSTRLTGVQANKLAGDATADAIAIREAGIREGYFNTPFGPRKVDVVVLGDDVLGIESKVGRTALVRIRQELAKDLWLRRQGQIDRLRWEFSPNEAGELGPNGPLLQKLQKHGVEVRINQANPTMY